MSCIRHTGIYVENLKKMKDFYCRIFGLKEFFHGTEKGMYIDTLLDAKDISLELYKLKDSGGSMLELLEQKGKKTKTSEKKVYDTGCMHIAITVKDINDAYKRLEREKIQFLSPPCTSADGKAKVCFCQDPEGNFLELVEQLQ